LKCLIWGVTKHSFNLWNALCWSWTHTYSISFFDNLFKGLATCEKFLTNFQLWNSPIQSAWTEAKIYKIERNFFFKKFLKNYENLPDTNISNFLLWWWNDQIFRFTVNNFYLVSLLHDYTNFTTEWLNFCDKIMI